MVQVCITIIAQYESQSNNFRKVSLDPRVRSKLDRKFQV
jgi:hypothetical protein